MQCKSAGQVARKANHGRFMGCAMWECGGEVDENGGKEPRKEARQSLREARLDW